MVSTDSSFQVEQNTNSNLHRIPGNCDAIKVYDNAAVQLGLLFFLSIV